MRSDDERMVWIITDSIIHAHGASQYSGWTAIMESIVPEPTVHGIDHLCVWHLSPCMVPCPRNL
jgi:hypothetical protein